MYFSWPVTDRFSGATRRKSPALWRGCQRQICEMWREMVRPAGFEPAAFGSGGQRSIQLSYGRVEEGSENRRRLVRPAGLEPATYGFEVRRSIQLSYGRTSHAACREAARCGCRNSG